VLAPQRRFRSNLVTLPEERSAQSRIGLDVRARRARSCLEAYSSNTMNSMRLRLSLLLFFAVCQLALTRPAYADDCETQTRVPFEVAFDVADYVLVGKVISVTPRRINGNKTLCYNGMQVLSVWKELSMPWGPELPRPLATVVNRTEYKPGEKEEPPYRIGATYLVFVKRDPSDGTLYTGNCPEPPPANKTLLPGTGVPYQCTWLIAGAAISLVMGLLLRNRISHP
jgi:hypothetical protein